MTRLTTWACCASGATAHSLQEAHKRNPPPRPRRRNRRTRGITRCYPDLAGLRAVKHVTRRKTETRFAIFCVHIFFSTCAESCCVILHVPGISTSRLSFHTHFVHKLGDRHLPDDRFRGGKAAVPQRHRQGQGPRPPLGGHGLHPRLGRGIHVWQAPLISCQQLWCVSAVAPRLAVCFLRLLFFSSFFQRLLEGRKRSEQTLSSLPKR